MDGTIIFYNLDDGSGLILSDDKQKYKFGIEMWDDLEHMPSIGLKVSFEIKDDTIGSIQKYVEPIVGAPTSMEDAGKMILQSDVFGVAEEELHASKLDANAYSTSSVPKGMIEVTMDRYFKSLENTVDKYKDYQLQSDDETLDYLKIKRFLFTAYNNLLEIDISLADGDLTQMYRNIEDIHSIYGTYKKSYMYPKIAFATIFLKHTRYKQAKSRLEKNIAEMGSIKSNLSLMESEIKEKIKKLGKLLKNDKKIIDLKQSIKHIKSLYVDSIDRYGTLREENAVLLPITNEYFEIFFEEFKKKFESSYETNIKNLINILNSMAFLFDRMMWEKACASKVIDRYFKDANITYPYSCLTYLRYYLKSLNKSKLTQGNKELCDLLEYLEKRNKKS